MKRKSSINCYEPLLRRLICIMICFVFCLPLYSYSAGTHSDQLCQVLFGYENGKALHDNVGDTESTKAFDLMRRAIAVAIDETYKKGTSSNDYKELRKKLAEKGVSIPAAELFEINNLLHRQVCHQGFDHYYSNSKYQNRWNVGRKLLIDTARAAFTYQNQKPNEPVVVFIAMISYYTHILGDLEEGETVSMKGVASQSNIGSFSGFVNELISKITFYGGQLSNQTLVSTLVQELNKISFVMPSETASKISGGNAQRKILGFQIRNVLRNYIPQIIQNNVNSIFIFNTNQQLNAA